MTLSVDAALQAFAPALPLGVALSGGADSTALLMACARRWPTQVVALHINHGLQAAAADFEAHCRALCQRLGVPLRVGRVAAAPAPGQSPEDAARTARYAGLAVLARAQAPADAAPGAGGGPGQGGGGVPYSGGTLRTIAVAHNADDQAETLLLALGRGAGMAGLAAMPAAWERDGLLYQRPWLRVSAAAIRAWLAQQGQSHVEDPTNAQLHYTRNHIRCAVLPALEAVFPHFRDTLARTATHAAQAQVLLDALARQDWHNAVGRSAAGLDLRALQALEAPRRANLLRYWLKSRHGVVPSAAQIEALQVQVVAARTRGHRIRIKVGPGFAVREGTDLAWYNQQDLLNQN